MPGGLIEAGGAEEVRASRDDRVPQHVRADGAAEDVVLRVRELLRQDPPHLHARLKEVRSSARIASPLLWAAG